LNTSDAGSAAFSCFLGHINGVVETKCFYSYSKTSALSYDVYFNAPVEVPVGNTGLGQLIPEWQLMNATSTGDHTNINAYVTYLNESATCM